MKRELNIRTPCKMSLSIMTAKISFLNSLLISLCYKSVKVVSCIKTDISVGGSCLVDVPAEIR